MRFINIIFRSFMLFTSTIDNLIFKIIRKIFVDLFVILYTIYFFASHPPVYRVSKNLAKTKFPHFCSQTMQKRGTDIEMKMDGILSIAAGYFS